MYDLKTYKETEDYKASLEFNGSEVFIHLEVYNWSVSVCKDIRQNLKRLLEELDDKGFELLFFYLPENVSVKFHNLIKKIDYEESFGDEDQSYKLYAWDTD